MSEPPARVAVAAPHHLAVDAARDVIAAGGGAVDAALAAAMALTVTYPHQCSIGGDLIAIVRRPDGSMTSVNASGRYGTHRRPADGQVPVSGPLSITVPGLVSGWDALHELGGTLPVARLLQPAIRLAAEGVQVTERLAAAISALDLDTDGDPGLRGLVTDAEGRRLAAGVVLRQEALARSLSMLAEDGLRSFYAGRLGDDLSVALQGLGASATRDDLRRHTPALGDVLTAEAAGCRLSTAPPSSQGYLFLSTMLAADRLAERGVEVDHRVLLELFVLTAAQREAELADPDHMPATGVELIDPAQVERDVAAVMARLEAPDAPRSMTPAVPRDGDTVAVTAAGADGTAVSLVQSLFHSFGARLHDPATGITFHNRAAGFSSGSGPNSLAPGKRPAHTLMPLIVEHADGWVAAHATMGGRQQPQIHTQVLRHRLAGATAADAVSAPRFVLAPLDRGGAYGVHAEPGLGDATLGDLGHAGLPLRRGTDLDEEVGHAMVCTLHVDGTLDAGADPRSDGATLSS
ncbi:gamma-glutamyltransferase [Nocardioides sp.]|uniref:gamma-glutamyltransferase n=1 Tax=Nocardioides sp. TaxID=35761 RepID=UPI002BA5F313|nr:gamma-glutamyltransferase [Nocardioides sp.]HXH80644.1 gamma-glutamyltransferase [Nocardioides sp.]